MKNLSIKFKSYVAAGIFVVIGVLLDQWTKSLAVAGLKGQKPIILIDKVFQLCYLENRGAAFGIFQNRITFFLISTPIILIIMIWLYGRFPEGKRYLPLRICSAAICAGAIGNMIDRVRLGYVIDFFYFNLIDFPIFNVADIYVTVSTFALLFLVFFYYREEDLEQIFKRRK
ncbi:MAG: signal peptidase II [Eubacteriales bacterium]|nr:signal peptidase II [Eubacteriales bacterium]